MEAVGRVGSGLLDDGAGLWMDCGWIVRWVSIDVQQFRLSRLVRWCVAKFVAIIHKLCTVDCCDEWYRCVQSFFENQRLDR